MDASLEANLFTPVPVLQQEKGEDSSSTFPRESRLLAESEFNAVFRHGVRVKLKKFTGQVALNTVGRARLGLAISKKSCRKASDRNRIKRLVREYFRHNKKDFGGRDFIVLANPKAAMSSSTTLRAELRLLFEKMCERTITVSSKSKF